MNEIEKTYEEGKEKTSLNALRLFRCVDTVVKMNHTDHSPSAIIFLNESDERGDWHNKYRV